MPTCVSCEIETENITSEGLCDDCDEVEHYGSVEELDPAPDLIGNEWYHEDLP